MTKKALKLIELFTIALIIPAANLFFKCRSCVDLNIVEANIDGGFIILLLAGLSYGGYKLYTGEQNNNPENSL